MLSSKKVKGPRTRLVSESRENQPQKKEIEELEMQFSGSEYGSDVEAQVSISSKEEKTTGEWEMGRGK